MNDWHTLETAMQALEAQRGVLGDDVVDQGLEVLRSRLELLRNAPPVEAQRLKQVTVLFMDVVGSTGLSQRLDPEDIHAVLDDTLAAATRIVEAHKGKVLQYAGDSLLAVFGADHSVEDDPERAVRAGLALLDEGHRRAALVAQQHGPSEFNLRVGVHTGSVLLGGGVASEASIRGTAVHIAARMEQTAPAGALRISHDTYRHVRGVFDVEVQLPMPIKGVDEPLTTYLVRRARPLAFRMRTRGIEGLPTHMVGRAAELRGLQAEFEAVGQSGRARAVTVVGEAGLGKSRLLHEFDQWAESHADASGVFRGRAHPHGQVQAYALLRELLLERFAGDHASDPALARRRFELGVAALFDTDLGADLAQGHAHLLGHLIGLDFRTSPHVAGIAEDRAQLRARGFHVAAQLVRRLAARGPVLLLLDDLHWADDASLAWLGELLQTSGDVPLSVVAATRPALFERHPDWLAEVPVHTRVALQPLDGAGSMELADTLLRRLPDAPPGLRELLIDGAAGNPFYMEELLEMLIDEGAVSAAGNRWSVRVRQLRALRVPPTLTGVLQARMDSLGEQGKRALQAAAIVGPVFWSVALAAIDARAVAALPSLIERDLVYEQAPSEFDGSRQFAFKHHLLHQVAYATVLKPTRRDGHARVAAWMSGQGAERTGAHLATIADHFEKGGDTPNACEYYTRAAEFAATRMAHEAASGAADRALALVDKRDLALRWRLHALLEGEFDLRAERDAQADALRTLEELCEALNDDARRADVALRRAYLAFRTAQYPQAQALAGTALELARRNNAQTLALRARHMQAIALYCLGDLEPAQAIALAGVDASRTLGERRLELRFVNALAVIAARNTDLVGGYAHDLRAMQLCRELGNRADEAVCLSNLGNTMLGFGDFDQARGYLDDALRLARAVGARFAEPHLLRHLAACALQRGDPAQAQDLARQAQALSIQIKDKGGEATSALCAAQAELALGNPAAAEAAFRRAQSLGTELDHPQRLDATAGLARTALARGAVDEATAHTESLLAHLAQQGSFDGAESPQRVHLDCFLVLNHLGDPRAARVLDDAYRELQKQAALISDPRLRECFLTRIAENRDIAHAWQLANQKTPAA